MNDVIIFGILDNAELAHYYLLNDSPHNVLGFTVHRQYMPESGYFKDLPVYPFEDIEERFSPKKIKLFAPLSPSKMNQIKEEIYNEIRSKGFGFISYVSSRATILTGQIGENCFILEDNTLQPFTIIKENVTLWSGNHIGHHSRVDSHVTITSHVVVSGHCHIEERCFLGVNSTLKDGIKLSNTTLVNMDASITKDTEAERFYTGVPAKKISDKPSYRFL